MNYRFPVRVYYEDTDAAGVVYYANYLKFMERARTEWLRELGYEQTELAREQGIVFVARSIAVEYLKPARLDDKLEIVSRIDSASRAQIVFNQRAERAGDLLTTSRIQIVCVDPEHGKVSAMPRRIHEKLKALIGPGN
jgi:acyl-CoA thioester hydrolase